MQSRFGISVALMIAWAGSASAVTLSGRVTDTANGGIYPVDIDVHYAGTSVLVPTPGDTTTPNGNYSITLDPGVYDVTYHGAPGAHFFSETVNSLNVQANTVRNVTLGRGHYLSGRIVRASDGSGVPLVNLNFKNAATGLPANNEQNDKTDSFGYFTALTDSAILDVEILAPQSERLVPVRITGIDLRSDQTLGTVSLAPGFLLSGTVTDEGYFPVVDADIDVRRAGTRTKWFTPKDNTDETGAWAVVLPAGVYDVTATGPPDQFLAPVTARGVALSDDLALPNLVLPPAVELLGRCRTAGGVDVSGVDVDVDSLPDLGRLETPNDQTDFSGNFVVLVPTGSFRVTLTPPVASRLLPVRLSPVTVSGTHDLGTVIHPAGHWVSGTVVEAGSGAPIAGANLDLIRISNGQAAITAGDLTDAAGFFRIVTDTDLYRLRVVPPTAAHDTLVVQPFRSLSDTTVSLTLTRNTVAVGETPNSPPLALSNPWPNPARDGMTIRFAAAGRASVEVWDIAGRRVAAVWNGNASGPAIARWDGRGPAGERAAAGLYFVTLTGTQGRVTRRVVIGR